MFHRTWTYTLSRALGDINMMLWLQALVTDSCFLFSHKNIFDTNILINKNVLSVSLNK